MLTIALFAVAVPIVITAVFLALRGRFTRLTADTRGIALQTIIIIVVLLAIAGAVAAVLLTRAGTETERLEEETDRWLEITNETGCRIADGVWTTGDDPRTPAVEATAEFCAPPPP